MTSIVNGTSDTLTQSAVTGSTEGPGTDSSVVAAAAAAAAAQPHAPVCSAATPSDTRFDPSVTLESLRADMAAFATERDWGQFHTPRNLVLALTGEVGELAELFQWRGEVGVGLPGWSAREREHLGEELSDVLLYLVRLSDRCGVDLGAAALRKMGLNRKKYPADKAKGRSDKYTAYGDNSSSGDEALQNASAGGGSVE